MITKKKDLFSYSYRENFRARSGKVLINKLVNKVKEIKSLTDILMIAKIELKNKELVYTSTTVSNSLHHRRSLKEIKFR